MASYQLLSVNFGKTKQDATGTLGIGYRLLDSAGIESTPRTTSGVYQTAPGIYSVYTSLPDGFRGQILWDTGTHYFPTASYASEIIDSVKIDEIYDAVTHMTGTINSLYDMQFGRWRIVNNQMIFFKEDNVTEIARFNLLDDAGNPTVDAVFERIRV